MDDEGSCNGITMEDNGSLQENESSTESLSDESSELDPDHPDYHLIMSAKLQKQKSKHHSST
jgi:hypothetical protein